MTTTLTRRTAGFTLIEVMVVVAIIGLLSTIAIPNFQRLTMRTKTAERSTMMLRIKQAVSDYYVRNGKIENTIGVRNPPFGSPASPGPAKRPMLDNQAGWNVYFTGNGTGNVNGEIEGSLYYSYMFKTTEGGGASAIEVTAYGDLDADNLISTKYIRWTRSSGVYGIDTETPAAGLEDDAAAPYTF